MTDDQFEPAPIARRSVIRAAAAAAALIPLAATPAAARPSGGPALVRRRGMLPSGIQIGDVTTTDAVLWSRCDQPGRLVAEVGRGWLRRRVVGSWAEESTDFTARAVIRGLPAGCDHDVRVWFEGERGVRSEVRRGGFATAPAVPGPVRFVWTGDTAGQGWGINPETGGMRGYRTMFDRNPDFLIHSGDNIYADGPILPEVKEPDGNVWRNLVTPEVSKVAESLKEFRGRYRYNQLDDNVQEMYAHVPVIAQWDDHEVVNNWYPGEIITDARYTEKRADVLAERGLRAFFENMPMDDRLLPHRGIYRKVSRGPHVDVFVLDMRTFRGSDPAAGQEPASPMLGEAQVQWLLQELRRSTATWKIIASDMPIGLIVPDGKDQEGVSDGVNRRIGGREHEMAHILASIKRNGVKNVVWLTADVHYCAAHYYDPAKAVRGDFDPFYEFVAGAIHAGSFGPNALDDTFGPSVLFQKTGEYPNQSPRFGKNQFFGQVDVSADGDLTVGLLDATGQVLFTKELSPARR